MERKNKFWKGFLLGMLSSLGTVALIGIFVVLVLTTKQIGSGNLGISNNRNYGLNLAWISGNYEKTELDKEKIMYKLQYLQNMVDKFFLFDQNPELVEDMIYTGFMAGFEDIYTGYYGVEDYQAMQESSSGTYYGIGAQISQNAKTGTMTITRVFTGSPALEAGLLPGDILYMVDGMDVTGMDLSTVVSYIKGGEGTYVNIEVYRPLLENYVDFDVVRRQVNIDTTVHQMLDSGIGYIQIMEFDDVTYSQFVEAYDELTAAGMEGLIIDLRGNPGGLLTSVVDILSEILPEGVIVYTEDKYGNGESYSSNNKTQIDIPMVVLIDENSASASEVFASAIRDYEWGTLVGTTSFGKGIVQSLIPLGDGTAVKITVSHYFTKSGREIHGVGVEPDVEVELAEELRSQAIVEPLDDNQVQAGMDVLREQLN